MSSSSFLGSQCGQWGGPGGRSDSGEPPRGVQHSPQAQGGRQEVDKAKGKQHRVKINKLIRTIPEDTLIIMFSEKEIVSEWISESEEYTLLICKIKIFLRTDWRAECLVAQGTPPPHSQSPARDRLISDKIIVVTWLSLTLLPGKILLSANHSSSSTHKLFQEDKPPTIWNKCFKIFSWRGRHK